MKPAKVNPALCRGFKVPPVTVSYTPDRPILYALGLGFSADPLDQKELDFTYEGSENFRAAPTFPLAIGDSAMIFGMLVACPGLPEFNPMMLLHGEQKVDLFRPMPTSGTITVKGEIVDVADKKSGALVVERFSLYDSDNQHLSDLYCKLFLRGIGGFGDKGTMNETIPPMPKRAPDKTATQRVMPSQAILYRLSGDKNPLHISKEFAEMGGFDRPILHGLCTYGIGAKAVLKEICDYDTSRFKSIYARFTSHVFPGETFTIDMWKEGNFVLFTMKTVERGKVALQGRVELTPTARL